MRKLFYFNKEKCTFESIKLKGYLPGLGALVVVFSLGWVLNSKVVTRILHGKSNTIVVRSTKFSEQALIEMLMDCNIKYPHIVLAQAKLESNNFKSDIFKYNNNLVGLKKARQRLTTAISERKGHAFYEDWKSCVYDIGIWQMAFTRDVTTEESYYQRLQERYAEDPQYASKLKNIVDKKHLKRLFEN
jgi:uncharacterized FlgJ-related protein